MLSTCPNCKRQIEHEDFLFEVSCQCGSRFNPFVDMQPAQEAGASTSMMMESSVQGMQESKALFDELKEYGENPTAEKTPQTKDSSIKEMTESSSPSVENPKSHSGQIFSTSADVLPGYTIQSVIGFVSAIQDWDQQKTEPLKSAVQQLEKYASKKGANAVLSVKWGFSPDGAHILVTGTAVRLQ